MLNLQEGTEAFRLNTDGKQMAFPARSVAAREIERPWRPCVLCLLGVNGDITDTPALRNIFIFPWAALELKDRLCAVMNAIHLSLWNIRWAEMLIYKPASIIVWQLATAHCFTTTTCLGHLLLPWRCWLFYCNRSVLFLLEAHLQYSYLFMTVTPFICSCNKAAYATAAWNARSLPHRRPLVFLRRRVVA